MPSIVHISVAASPTNSQDQQLIFARFALLIPYILGLFHPLVRVRIPSSISNPQLIDLYYHGTVVGRETISLTMEEFNGILLVITEITILFLLLTMYLSSHESFKKYSAELDFGAILGTILILFISVYRANNGKAELVESFGYEVEEVKVVISLTYLLLVIGLVLMLALHYERGKVIGKSELEKQPYQHY